MTALSYFLLFFGVMLTVMGSISFIIKLVKAIVDGGDMSAVLEYVLLTIGIFMICIH